MTRSAPARGGVRTRLLALPADDRDSRVACVRRSRPLPAMRKPSRDPMEDRHMRHVPDYADSSGMIAVWANRDGPCGQPRLGMTRRRLEGRTDESAGQSDLAHWVVRVSDRTSSAVRCWADIVLLRACRGGHGGQGKHPRSRRPRPPRAGSIPTTSSWPSARRIRPARSRHTRPVRWRRSGISSRSRSRRARSHIEDRTEQLRQPPRGSRAVNLIEPRS